MGGRGSYGKLGMKGNPYRNMTSGQLNGKIKSLKASLSAQSSKMWESSETARYSQGAARSNAIARNQKAAARYEATQKKLSQAQKAAEYRKNVQTREQRIRQVKREASERRQRERTYGGSLF